MFLRRIHINYLRADSADDNQQHLWALISISFRFTRRIIGNLSSQLHREEKDTNMQRHFYRNLFQPFISIIEQIKTQHWKRFNLFLLHPYEFQTHCLGGCNDITTKWYLLLKKETASSRIFTISYTINRNSSWGKVRLISLRSTFWQFRRLWSQTKRLRNSFRFQLHTIA